MLGKKECLDSTMLNQFIENQLKETEKDAFENIACKTNKHFGIPFDYYLLFHTCRRQETNI
jgi:hypothetical protein